MFLVRINNEGKIFDKDACRKIIEYENFLDGKVNVAKFKFYLKNLTGSQAYKYNLEWRYFLMLTICMNFYSKYQGCFHLQKMLLIHQDQKPFAISLIVIHHYSLNYLQCLYLLLRYYYFHYWGLQVEVNSYLNHC